jgi:enoyl-CoA hydratase/carnithine racemase
MSIDLSVSDEGVALITINRPERLNAMDADHYKGLSDACGMTSNCNFHTIYVV